MRFMRLKSTGCAGPGAALATSLPAAPSAGLAKQVLRGVLDADHSFENGVALSGVHGVGGFLLLRGRIDRLFRRRRTRGIGVLLVAGVGAVGLILFGWRGQLLEVVLVDKI